MKGWIHCSMPDGRLISINTAHIIAVFPPLHPKEWIEGTRTLIETDTPHGFDREVIIPVEEAPLTVEGYIKQSLGE